ncbi:MAG: glycoside hydrolase family 5 protein [Saccharofermentans sp.]|nr:glycoside hydrolase family 5 protein [Saccharofermentans sp.]
MSKILRGLTVLGLAGAFMLCSCTTNLGPETLPSTTPSTEPTETLPEETEPTETSAPEETEPSSVALITDSIVEKEGRLKTDGTKIVNSEGDTVVLKGISSFGIGDCEGFFTSEIVKTLAEDWGCDVLRIAITGSDNTEGYLDDPDRYFDMVCKICDMCTDQGIYVIVDWDVNYSEDQDVNKDAAVDFFKRLSTIYSESVNVIYEVNNYPLVYEEPEDDDDEDDETNEWEDIIKPFASEVIDAVRENSPDSLIIVGAPNKGLEIDAVSDSELDYENIAYGCRFFSGTHRQEQRDRVQEAIDDEICVFVTEWSYCTEDLKGGIFTQESDKWAEFLDENEISWCNIAIGSDADNDTNALLMNTDKYTFEQIRSGHWPEGLLSKSGLYARDQFLKDIADTEDADQTEETTEETSDDE